MTDRDIHDRLDRLESIVDRQQARLESQDATIERQRETIETLLERPSPDTGSGAIGSHSIGRRTALKAGGALALLGVGAGTASADPQGQVGTENDPLKALHAREIDSESVTVDTLDATNSDDTDGAAGVYGEAEATSGDVYGVRGETNSTENVAAGVLGESPGSGANGVMGLANVDVPADRADEAGVYGETSAAPGYGVFGNNTASSGTYAEGVYGRTNSPESAAITGENTEDGVGVKSDGSLEVVGHTDVTKVGMSAYLSSNQTIDDDVTTTVLFDSTNVDHFNGYDTATGQYTIQKDGDYHVSFTIDWQTNFSAGVHIDYELQINEDTTGGIQADTTTATSNQRVCRSFSRTLFGLSEGDTLEVAVAQQSGSTADLFGAGQETYLTLFKIG